MTGLLLTEREQQKLQQTAFQTACHFELKTMRKASCGVKKEQQQKKGEKRGGGRGVGHDRWTRGNKSDDDKCGVAGRSISRPSSVSSAGCLSALSAM